MSLQSVAAFLALHAPDIEIVAFAAPTTTASMSEAWGILPAQVAKSLILRTGKREVLAVICGDARVDNAKTKAAIGGKVSMVPLAESQRITGHPPGGVCPIGLERALPVFFDIGLRRFDHVVPGAGRLTTRFASRPRRWQSSPLPSGWTSSGTPEEKGPCRNKALWQFVVERRRIELPTFALRTRRSPS